MGRCHENPVESTGARKSIAAQPLCSTACVSGRKRLSVMTRHAEAIILDVGIFAVSG